MIKTIKIGEKSYDMKSSAFTMFAYKDKTGRDLLKDINYINTKYEELKELPEEEQTTKWLDELTHILENALKLAHIMILEQDKTFKGYDEWLKELDGLVDDPTWIMEVMELGMTPFHRGV